MLMDCYRMITQPAFIARQNLSRSWPFTTADRTIHVTRWPVGPHPSHVEDKDKEAVGLTEPQTRQCHPGP